MASRSSYIAARDAEALAWMQTFSAGISAQYAVYQMSSADAVTLAIAVAAFAAAMGNVQDPAKRTSVDVGIKDELRVSAEPLCRQFALLIKYNAGISDPNKIAIGVRPVNNSRTPIVAPSSSPLINVIGATPGSQTGRYADSVTPDSSAKPLGAPNSK